MITRQFRGASDRVHTDGTHGVAILRRFLHRYDLAVHQIGVNEREQHSVELREMSPEHLELHREVGQDEDLRQHTSLGSHVVSDPHEGNEELATDHGQLFDDSQHLPLLFVEVVLRDGAQFQRKQSHAELQLQEEQLQRRVADQVREEDPADRRLRRQRGVEGTADGPVASQQHGRDELGEGAETEVAEQLLAVYRVFQRKLAAKVFCDELQRGPQKDVRDNPFKSVTDSHYHQQCDKWNIF